jgi:hypothetical protein
MHMNISSSLHNPRKILRALRKRARRSQLLVLAPLCNLVYLVLTAYERTATRIWHSGKPQYEQSGEIDLILCFAVGPGELVGVEDILASARSYIGTTYRVVVVDDSGTIAVWRTVRKCADVDYIRNWRPLGFAGLPKSLSKAFRHALKNYEGFKALLKVDTDSLVTGPGIGQDIVSYFEANRGVGMLGSYRFTCTGAVRDFSSVGDLLRQDLRYWLEPVEKARQYGYEMGEHAQGGAYALSRACVEDMERAGYLDARVRGSMNLEDIIFSLYVRSLGYEIHEFAMKGPFAIAYRGLPIPKEEVVRQHKKVVHSVKFDDEDLEIRDYFRGLLCDYQAQKR